MALLLTYIHERSHIRVIPPLQQLLAKPTPKDLIAIIEKMVKSNPELIDVIEVSVNPSDNAQPNFDRYRRQAEIIFKGDRMRPVAQHLATLIEEANVLEENDDWIGAGEIYHCLLEVANQKYDYLVMEIDYDGEVACEIQDIAAGLGSCLNNADAIESDRHQRWINCLLQAVFQDVELGGIDYADPARDALIAHASDREWDAIEQAVRRQIQQLSSQSYSDWSKESLVQFLEERVTKSKQNTDSLILELGSPKQKAFFHLERGNLDQAIAIAKQDFLDKPGLVSDFADALLATQSPKLALEFVEFCQQGRRGSSIYLDWLANYHKEHGSTENYIAIATEQLQSCFSSTQYQELKSKAKPLKQWKALHKKILASYQEKQYHHWLLDIAIIEQDWDQALIYLNQVKGWNRQAYHFKLAQAAKGDRPELAIQLYLESIEQLIIGRGRNNYRQAAQHLKDIQQIYHQTKKARAFKSLIQKIRSKNANLPALQDELDRAGL